MCKVEVVLIFLTAVFVSVSCDSDGNKVQVIKQSVHRPECFGCPLQWDSFTCYLPRCNCKFASIQLQNFDLNESLPLPPPHPSPPPTPPSDPSLNPVLHPPPKIHCQDYDKISLKWNNRANNTFYYINYRVQPGPRHLSMDTNMTRCGYEILRDLYPDTTYRIELRSVTITENGTRYRRGHVTFTKTQQRNNVPDPVARFYLDKWILANQYYIAQVKWIKGPDNACSYNLVVLSDDGDFEEDDITDPLNDDSFNITDLSFGKQYFVAITAFNENNRLEGPKTWLNLTVPSCFETYKASRRCIPDQPENLTVDEILLDSNKDRSHPCYDIHLSWKKPQYPPEFYAANLRLLDDNVTNYFLNITGENSNATFHNIKLTTQYQVMLVAYSAKGHSKIASIHRHVNESFWRNLEQSPISYIEIALTIIGPCLVLTLAVIFVLNHYLGKRAKKRERNIYFQELDGKLPNSTTLVNTIPVSYLKPDKWDIDIDRLVIKEIVGQGAFGIVRRGWYTKREGTDIEVAIKMLRDPPTNEELKQFCQEIEIMKAVPPHPHLVSLVGCAVKKAPLLVVEYCAKGDLQTYLRTAHERISKACAIDVDSENYCAPNYASNKLYDMSQEDTEDIPQHKDLLSFARQVTLGMEYLASLKVIHRDLAARNVLICDKNIIKISDFGLSRDVYYDNVYCKMGGGKLPIRWMAIESLTLQVYTTQSDVWSFGILLWEIITLGSTPYPGVHTQELLAMLKSGYRMPKPDNCGDEIYSLMRSCWKEDPKSRPSFSDIRCTLDGLLEGYTHYLNMSNSVEKVADIRCDNLES